MTGHRRLVVLVMDYLSTDTSPSLDEAFEPAHAQALLDRLELVFTPEHGG